MDTSGFHEGHWFELWLFDHKHEWKRKIWNPAEILGFGICPIFSPLPVDSQPWLPLSVTKDAIWLELFADLLRREALGPDGIAAEEEEMDRQDYYEGRQ